MSSRRKVVEEAQDEPQGLPFHLKYRPARWKDVWGQDAVVASIEAAIKSKSRPHAFVLTGPSGTGKTTLARIAAKELNVLPANLTEIDAASNTGIDDMRAIMAPLRYQGFGEAPNKALIVDEAHRLSKQAWDSLLKSVEEPPAHVYWFFCSTEPGKIPAAIMTRCASYTLRPLGYDDIMDLLELVREKEDLPTTDKVLRLIAQSCNGAARQALVMLQQAHDAQDEEEAARLFETVIDNAEIIDLCRLLVRGELNWSKLVATLKAMPEMPAESIRITVVNYLAACAMGAKGDKEAMRLLDMLDSFSKPFPQSDKLAPLLLAFGDHLFR